MLRVGGGIMSATLGVLLKELAPERSVLMVEALDELAAESSEAWNNAGTGHAALCELNYTPQQADGSVAIEKAVQINEQFQQSLGFWSTLVERGRIAEPREFLNPVPHMSFVAGAVDVAFLRKRFEALRGQPLFCGMRYSEDRAEIAEWTPLMMQGRRGSEPVAMTRAEFGTDVDFGTLTRKLVQALQAQPDFTLRTGTRAERWAMVCVAGEPGQRRQRAAAGGGAFCVSGRGRRGFAAAAGLRGGRG